MPVGTLAGRPPGAPASPIGKIAGDLGDGAGCGIDFDDARPSTDLNRAAARQLDAHRDRQSGPLTMIASRTCPGGEQPGQSCRASFAQTMPSRGDGHIDRAHIESWLWLPESAGRGPSEHGTVQNGSETKSNPTPWKDVRAAKPQFQRASFGDRTEHRRVGSSLLLGERGRREAGALFHH